MCKLQIQYLAYMWGETNTTKIGFVELVQNITSMQNVGQVTQIQS